MSLPSIHFTHTFAKTTPKLIRMTIIGYIEPFDSKLFATNDTPLCGGEHHTALDHIGTG